MDQPRAKPRLLNKALLSDIASTAVEKQMQMLSVGWMRPVANKLPELYSSLLKLDGTTWSCGEKLDHLVRVITENKSSLKVLSGVPEPLFGRLPSGLTLDEFSPCSVKPSDVKIPALNTKVFKYNVADDMKIHLEFMRTINAEEIHLRIKRLLPDRPENPRPFGVKPANHRTKKVRVDLGNEREGDMDFDRMCREVAVCFPKLECFEVVYKKRFGTRNTYEEFTGAVDALVARFERALKEAETAPYEVHLKTHVWYTHYEELVPEETDFKCGLLKIDLPPSKEVELDAQHSYFVKEMSTDGKNLRVDCEIVEGTESFDDHHEDSYDYDPYGSDGDGDYFSF